MSSINKAVFRTVGVFALIASAVFLFIYVFGLSKLTTVQGFMHQVGSLAIICMGFYGGLQLLKLRKVGHRLLIVWLLSQLLTAVFAFPTAISSLFFSGNFPINAPIPMLKPLIAAYYLLYPVVLISLFATRTAKASLADDNPRHMRLLATLLSVLTPGLARALVGNLLVGMILFYSYGQLITGPANWEVGPESLDRILKFWSYPAGWAMLAAVDWYAVKEFERSERIKNNSVSDLAPEQFNGG